MTQAKKTSKAAKATKAHKAEPSHAEPTSLITITGVAKADVDLVPVMAAITDAAVSVYDHVTVTHHPAGEPVDHSPEAFAIAQKWSVKPDLTPRERVHGAVHDMHVYHAQHQARDDHGRFAHVEPSQAYSIQFETHFVDDIKARSIRAAKELFGQ